MYQVISHCRICKNKNLVEILTLGEQTYSGIFPQNKDQLVPSGPLTLVKCDDEANKNCGLVQLKHSFELEQLYGDNYGYRSGLNSSMVAHLQHKIKGLTQVAHVKKDDLVIDIGSNDATTLKAYSSDLDLLGIDPVGNKFREYYPSYIKLLSDFFNTEKIQKIVGDKKAKIVTSFSMFYDLEDPLKFMHDVHKILDDDGVWCFEQSYLPSMLKMNSFDTICHEHLEYYHLKPIFWMCQEVGFKIIDIQFNEINGGSISIAVAKQKSLYPSCDKLVGNILAAEERDGLSSIDPYREFSKRIFQIKNEIKEFFLKTKKNGQKIFGLGASTKGNTILQYCGLTNQDLISIGEVNKDKWGKFTPGSLIPIVAEEEVLESKPDYLFVLPWHFSKFFASNKKFTDCKLIYPLSISTGI